MPAGRSLVLAEKITLERVRLADGKHSHQRHETDVIISHGGKQSVLLSLIGLHCVCRPEPKALPRATITAGRRSSWRSARSGSPVIRREKHRLGRSRICGERRGRLKRSLPNRPWRSPCNVPTRTRVTVDSQTRYRFRPVAGAIRKISAKVTGSRYFCRSPVNTTQLTCQF